MSGTGFQRGECSRPKRSLLLESMGLQWFRKSGKCHQISHFKQSMFPRTKSKIFVTRRFKCYLPTVGSPSETKMIRETDSGSSIPKLLASFKIKMARRRASLIFVPIKVTHVLFCYVRSLCTKTVTSWVQIRLSGDYSCIVYLVPKSFDCFPSDTNFPQAGQDSPVE